MKLLFIVLAEKRTRRCWVLDGSLCQHRFDEELEQGWVAGKEHPGALGMQLGLPQQTGCRRSQAFGRCENGEKGRAEAFNPMCARGALGPPLLSAAKTAGAGSN